MFRRTLTLIAVGAIASPLAAQELTYSSASLDYSRYMADGQAEDSAITRFSGDAELTYDNFLFGFGAGRFSLTNEDFEFLINELNVSAAYMITPEILAGFGLTSTSGDADGFTEDYNGYEVFAQFDTGQYGGAVRYLLPDTEDEEFYFTQFFASAVITPELEAVAVIESIWDTGNSNSYFGAGYDAGQIYGRGYYATISEADFGVFGLSGSYRFDDKATATASYQTLMGEDVIDYNAFTVGGAYAFMDSVSAEASYTLYSGIEGFEDVSSFTIGLTYETGSQKRLDRSLWDVARGDLNVGELSFAPFRDFGLLGFGGFAG